MRASAVDREQRVLEALIKIYIARQEPVSSRLLEASGDLGIKSASIRAILSELEKKGYLAQPHASSGRVPTDAGYRAYVNHLLPESLMEEDSRALNRALTEAGEDLTQILKGTVRLLGQFSSNIGIMAGPREQEVSKEITGVELYDRGGGRILLVVYLQSKAVRTEIVELGRDVRSGILIAASAFLAERLTGRTLEDTRRELDLLLRASADEAKELAKEVASQGHSVFGPEQVLQFTFDGIPAALEQPEFGDPERLKALLQVIAQHELFEQALESFVAPSAGEISLAIGKENPLAALHPFTLMATRYEIGGVSGYLGVLGPRRMRYARTLALIHGIAGYLDRLR